jgi:hypothetical protein
VLDAGTGVVTAGAETTGKDVVTAGVETTGGVGATLIAPPQVANDGATVGTGTDDHVVQVLLVWFDAGRDEVTVCIKAGDDVATTPLVKLRPKIWPVAKAIMPTVSVGMLRTAPLEASFSSKSNTAEPATDLVLTDTGSTLLRDCVPATATIEPKPSGGFQVAVVLPVVTVAATPDAAVPPAAMAI